MKTYPMSEIDTSALFLRGFEPEAAADTGTITALKATEGNGRIDASSQIAQSILAECGL